MSLASESDPCGEIHDALEAESNGLHARLAIALARQEAAEHGHQAHHLVQSEWGLGHLLPIQDIRRLPLIPLEQQGRIPG